MALHDVCTYDASTKSGGANGTVRTPKELERPENTGLESIIRALQSIASENAPLTFADTLQVGKNPHPPSWEGGGGGGGALELERSKQS